MAITKKMLREVTIQEYKKLIYEKMLLDGEEEKILTDNEECQEECDVKEAMTVGGGSVFGMQMPLGSAPENEEESEENLSEGRMKQLQIEIEDAVINCILDCQESLQGLNDDNFEDYLDYDGSEGHVTTVSQNVSKELGVSVKEVNTVINSMLAAGDINSDSSGYLSLP